MQQKSYFEDFTGAQESVQAVCQGQKSQTQNKQKNPHQNQPSKIKKYFKN